MDLFNMFIAARENYLHATGDFDNGMPALWVHKNPQIEMIAMKSKGSFQGERSHNGLTIVALLIMK